MNDLSGRVSGWGLSLPRPVWGDLIAGISVATVLIPQSMAYAELAGLPAFVGLIAAALPPIAAAIFASSPYLQTGPVAMTSLLTAGALVGLAAPFSSEYIKLAAMLALVVGVVRAGVGLLRAGVVAYLMSQPVIMGFTNGAAILIIASQIPTAVAADPPDGRVLQRAWWTLIHPGEWEPEAVMISVLTAVVIVIGRRFSPLFPGVLIAVVGGIVFSLATDYAGPVLDNVPSQLPNLSLDLPWNMLDEILLAGAVIALVGFAEPASIARAYAARERTSWSPDREFLSQGTANVVSGLTGAFPVGGSFSRTSINHLAGAKTRWSGAITGFVVLVFLPFASVLEPLPKAVLAAIVITAVAKLLRLDLLIKLWKFSKPQALIAWITFAATLVLAPRIDLAVLVGIVTAVAVHLWRESDVDVELEVRRDGTARIRPEGVFWFGSAPELQKVLNELLVAYPQAKRVEVDLSGLGRVDYSSAVALREVIDDAREAGLGVYVIGVPDHARRILLAVWGDELEQVER